MMLCMGCQYRLNDLAANRCPECGRAFNHHDESTFLKSPGRAPLPWPVRAVIVIGGFGLWYFLTMRHASANTSWESHSLAGPFIIIIKESLGESHSASDWAFALLFWVFFVSFPLHWIVAGRWWSGLITIVLCVAMLALGRFAAIAASC